MQYFLSHKWGRTYEIAYLILADLSDPLCQSLKNLTIFFTNFSEFVSHFWDTSESHQDKSVRNEMSEAGMGALGRNLRESP